jgi:hypothetical protein
VVLVLSDCSGAQQIHLRASKIEAQSFSNRFPLQSRDAQKSVPCDLSNPSAEWWQ